MIDEYVLSGGRKLRMGITTGTCAALAASGAARMLLSGRPVREAQLMTPKGIRVTAPLLDISMEADAVSCAVRKDAGDDKDATDGMLIYARASFGQECPEDVPGQALDEAEQITIDGGEGIGRVTLPGLDQPVGAAAINSVPRKMIGRAARDAAEAYGYDGSMKIMIYAPSGAEIAKKTFNPRLGIEGGISILGTSGIVEPMSLSALMDSIALEIRQKAALGNKRLILTPGNYGLAFLSEWTADNDADRLSGMSAERLRTPWAEKNVSYWMGVPVVVCSNFIGDALDVAGDAGFEDVLLVGHIGKLVKLAGGIMNTHSRTADCRMEIITAHAALSGADAGICRELMQSVTTDACIEILKKNGLYEDVAGSLVEKAGMHLQERAQDTYRVGAVLFSNVYGFIGETAGAREIISDWTAGRKFS